MKLTHSLGCSPTRTLPCRNQVVKTSFEPDLSRSLAQLRSRLGSCWLSSAQAATVASLVPRVISGAFPARVVLYFYRDALDVCFSGRGNALGISTQWMYKFSGNDVANNGLFVPSQLSTGRHYGVDVVVFLFSRVVDLQNFWQVSEICLHTSPSTRTTTYTSTLFCSLVTLRMLAVIQSEPAARLAAIAYTFGS